MRHDGRAEDALRPIGITPGFIETSAGSVLIAYGCTRVICTANFSERVPGFLRDSGSGWVTAEYSMLPGSTTERTDRSKASGGRAQEISRLIGRSLRAVTDLKSLGPCLVNIDCDVIRADGGTRTAAITGAYVALYEALRSAVEKKNIPRIPLRTACAAVSVGIIEGSVLLDLDYREDFKADVDMNLVMDEAGNYIEVQGCAEGKPFSRNQLDAMLDLGRKGTRALMDAQRETLGLD